MTTADYVLGAILLIVMYSLTSAVGSDAKKIGKGEKRFDRKSVLNILFCSGWFIILVMVAMPRLEKIEDDLEEKEKLIAVGLKDPDENIRLATIDSILHFYKENSLVAEAAITDLVNVSAKDENEEVRVSAANGVFTIWNEEHSATKVFAGEIAGEALPGYEDQLGLSSKYVVWAGLSLLLSSDPENRRIGIENVIIGFEDESYAANWRMNADDQRIRSVAKDVLRQIAEKDSDYSNRTLAVEALQKLQ